MNKTKQKRYPAEFKAKVEPEVFRDAHANRKRQTIEKMTETLSGKTERANTNNESQTRALHANIEELTIERNF